MLYCGMARDDDQPGIELCFGFCHEEYCWWALTGTSHGVVLHCFSSAGSICHEIDQFRYFEKGGGDAIRVSKHKVHCGVYEA